MGAAIGVLIWNPGKAEYIFAHRSLKSSRFLFGDSEPGKPTINFIYTMKKICLECDEPFIGRADKKFCSDMCRNAFHNRHYGGRNTVIRNTNNILKRNRTILMNLWENRMHEMQPADLEELGFDFRFFTQERSDTRGCWRYCYEYAYTVDEREKIRLMLRPNMNLQDARLMLAAESTGEYLRKLTSSGRHNRMAKKA